jgi:hypothetical protein
MFAFEARDKANSEPTIIIVSDSIYTNGDFVLVSELMFVPASGKYQQSDPVKMTYSWQVTWERGRASGSFIVDYSDWNWEARG